MGKLSDKRLVFIDTETTGLDAAKHEVIDFAAISVAADGTVERVSFKLAPEHLDRADAKALEINGYTPAGWTDALSQEEGARRMVAVLTDCVAVGHNVEFDMGFIRATVVRHLGDKAARKLPFHKVDTIGLACAMLRPYGIEKLSLESVCNFLGISNEGAHTALADVTRCKAVYDRLSRVTWLDRLRWSWASRKAR